MNNYVNLRDIIYTINGEKPLVLDVEHPSWTQDYKEGYIDGLQRALELIDELDSISKCLYCDNLTDNPHFTSGCCGRGMCEDCYNGLVGTDEQLQIPFVDEETYQQFSEQINKIENMGFDYICYEHMQKNKVPA